MNKNIYTVLFFRNLRVASLVGILGSIIILTMVGLDACDDKREITIGYRIILLEDKQQQVEAKVIKVTKKMCPHEEQVQFLLPSGAVTELYKLDSRVLMDIMITDVSEQAGTVNVMKEDASYTVNIII